MSFRKIRIIFITFLISVFALNSLQAQTEDKENVEITAKGNKKVKHKKPSFAPANAITIEDLRLQDDIAPQTVSFTLEEAVAFALKNNKDLMKTKNEVFKAVYAKREAIGSYIPQASASMDYNNYFGAKAQFGEMSIDFDPTSTLTAQVSQLAFSGNAIVGILLGEIAQEMASINTENKELTLEKTVKMSYNAALLTEATYEILQQNVEDIRIIAEHTQKMVTVGVMEQTDADQLLVQVNLLENMIKNSERNIELSYNTLKIQLGVNIDDTIVLANSLDDILNSKNDIDILNTAYNLYADPNFRLVSKSEEIAKKNKLMGIMNFLPTISGFYQYTGKILKPRMDMSPENVIGIKAQIPIFSGLVNTNKHRQARIDLYNAELDKAIVSDQLRIQEKQLRFNLKTALEQYTTQKLNVDVAIRVFNSFKLKYEQGVQSSMDLTNANTDYLKAQTDYLTSILEVLRARVELEKLLVY